jgi:2-(3-amino-3-carboxypropyl)histidine synthase
MTIKQRTIEELNEVYDLELDRVVSEIKSSKAKLVLLQFPDGLKIYATAVVDYLKDETNGKVEFLIWMESCYGACDSPVGIEKMSPKIDLVIQFGHSEMMPGY